VAAITAFARRNRNILPSENKQPLHGPFSIIQDQDSTPSQMMKKPAETYKPDTFYVRERNLFILTRTNLSDYSSVQTYGEALHKAFNTLNRIAREEIGSESTPMGSARATPSTGESTTTSLPEWWLLLSFLHGLPREYDNFISSMTVNRPILNGKRQDPTFLDAYSDLLSREWRAANLYGTAKGLKDSREPPLTGRGKKHPKGPKDKCSLCNLQYHNSTNCWFSDPSKASESWRLNNMDKIKAFRQKANGN